MAVGSPAGRRSAHRELVAVHQFGYVERRGRRGWRPRAWLRRPVERLPMLQLVVTPGASIDFADPATGFPGLGRTPPAERVLELWSDELVTVSHGTAWSYVVDAHRPFDRAWLDLLSVEDGGLAAVLATFAGPTPVGSFRLADVDAHTYATLAHVRDHRP